MGSSLNELLAGNNGPIFIDIWGSCVTRDACEIGIKKGSIVINNYFQDCDYPIQFTPHILPNIAEDNIEADIIDFDKRNITYDWNKTITSKLQNSGSKWLILDSRVVSYGLYKITTNNGIEYFSGNKIKHVVEVLENLGIRYELTQTDYSDPCIKTAFMDFIKFCKKRYGNNIVLLEVFESTISLQKNGSINYSDYINRYDSLEHDVKREATFNYYFCKNVDCYYIKMPFNTLADESHKWGPGPVHYVGNYYCFVYETLMAIFTSNNPDKDVNNLYRKYEMLLANTRYLKKQSISSIVNYCKENDTNENNDTVKQTILHLLKDDNPELMLYIDYLLDKIWQMNDPDTDAEMIDLIRPYAEKGEKYALQRLGKAYMEGRGVKKDLNEAARLINMQS